MPHSEPACAPMSKPCFQSTRFFVSSSSYHPFELVAVWKSARKGSVLGTKPAETQGKGSVVPCGSKLSALAASRRTPSSHSQSWPLDTHDIPHRRECSEMHSSRCALKVWPKIACARGMFQCRFVLRSSFETPWLTTWKKPQVEQASRICRTAAISAVMSAAEPRATSSDRSTTGTPSASLPGAAAAAEATAAVARARCVILPGGRWHCGVCIAAPMQLRRVHAKAELLAWLLALLGVRMRLSWCPTERWTTTAGETNMLSVGVGGDSLRDSGAALACPAVHRPWSQDHQITFSLEIGCIGRNLY